MKFAPIVVKCLDFVFDVQPLNMLSQMCHFVIKLNLRIRPTTFQLNTVFDVIPAIRSYGKLIEKMQPEFSIVYRSGLANNLSPQSIFTCFVKNGKMDYFNKNCEIN